MQEFFIFSVLLLKRGATSSSFTSRSSHSLTTIRKTAEFCKDLGDAVTVVQLLPYHSLGAMKYLRISDQTPVEAIPPSDEYMQKLKAIFEELGVPAKIH